MPTAFMGSITLEMAVVAGFPSEARILPADFLRDRWREAGAGSIRCVPPGKPLSRDAFGPGQSLPAEEPWGYRRARPITTLIFPRQV